MSISPLLSPTILADRLAALGVPESFIIIVNSFLCDRQQYVRIGNQKSAILSSSKGCPQGCVFSSLLSSIYTDEFRSLDPNINIFKYADDMVIVGLLRHNDHSYFNTITRFTTWGQVSNLILNTDKTKRMVFDFSRMYDITSNVFIANKHIAKVLGYKYLGTIFSHDLKWQVASDS